MDIEEDQDNQTHLLSTIIKHSIVLYKLEGEKSNKQIDEQVFLVFKRQIGNSIVQRVWQKYQEIGDISNQWSHQGRPTPLSEEDEQRVIDMVREDRLSSSKEIVEKLELDVSRQTVNKMLINECYKSYK